MSSRPTGDPPTNDVKFGALTDSIWRGRCVAVLGAGISAADYPLWPSLLGRLQERCGVRAEDVQSTDALDIAQVAREKNAAEYFRTLDEIFDRLPAPKSAVRYHLLARIKFISYVTLNFDPLLVDVLDMHDNVTVSDYPNLQSQNHNKQEIFCMHGRLGPGRPASKTPIVLTRRDFEEAYHPYVPALHSFLQQTLLSHDVCFLGCNPSEPNLARILAACRHYSDATHGLTSSTKPNWYLLAEDGYEKLEEVTACGVHVVEYSRRDHTFSGLDDVLAYWAKKKPPFIRPAGVQESTFNTDAEPDRR